jgi:hypothetical protein
VSRKLLVVTDAFVAGGRGVLVEPRVTVDDPPRTPFKVKLRLPSGEERETSASMDVAHMRGKLAPYAMYRLMDVQPADVPAGTEIWSVD